MRLSHLFILSSLMLVCKVQANDCSIQIIDFDNGHVSHSLNPELQIDSGSGFYIGKNESKQKIVKKEIKSFSDLTEDRVSSTYCVDSVRYDREDAKTLVLLARDLEFNKDPDHISYFFIEFDSVKRARSTQEYLANNSAILYYDKWDKKVLPAIARKKRVKATSISETSLFLYDLSNELFGEFSHIVSEISGTQLQTSPFAFLKAMIPVKPQHNKLKRQALIEKSDSIEKENKELLDQLSDIAKKSEVL